MANRTRSCCVDLFRGVTLAAVLLICTAGNAAKVVIFRQRDFPVASSQPVSRTSLMQVFQHAAVAFAGVDALREPATLAGADLLVLPYGSAFPSSDWTTIRAYLLRGGNLLIIGGQPFRVPVRAEGGRFHAEPPEDTYSRELGFRHTYAVPVPPESEFHWRAGYGFLAPCTIHARRFFTVEGQLDGLGYMSNARAERVAAPVIVADRFHVIKPGGAAAGSRMVMLDFEPAQGYLDSPDGIVLMRAAASYASQGAVRFWTEIRFSAIRPNEIPAVSVHLRDPSEAAQQRTAEIELRGHSGVLYKAAVAMPSRSTDVDVPFGHALPAGFYTVRAKYLVDGHPRESYENGFWVEDESQLRSGPRLGVKGNFLTLNSAPFLPFGTNYFTTEENGWDFSGARNAAVWNHDFADMRRHGVTFVRTGVWMSNAAFVDRTTGQVSERFLRNFEAYLRCAESHHIAVNFTFFAFTPRSGEHGRSSAAAPNPYLNPEAVQAERDYVVSVVRRFRDVPWLSWDLINEPSFSNPAKNFRGNIPNGDANELEAWHGWLQDRYRTVDALAAAWAVTPNHFVAFHAVPLPSEADLKPSRYGNRNQVRAFDYNLFAQDMFTGWVRVMVAAIRETGSTQLIDVGQDEGGVTDRLLDQFFVQGGVSFTVNHTYWQDDALLWDSVVAKRPGVPDFTGETGYQPVWSPDGAWRYDELTGTALVERKWALGFAAGSTGALQWDWAREPDFGMERSDGSAKTWESMMTRMGAFAKAAAPYATGLSEPQVALVLPQSLQLSIDNRTALHAQQNAVRALYHYARAEAYAVGEYQLEQLGSPRLIIVPSPLVLSSGAWKKLLAKVREGSTMLITGPFDEDPHFHPTGRQNSAGLPYKDAPLTSRDLQVQWPGGSLHLTYGGDATTYLTRAVLPDGKQWEETKLGAGRILFSPLPIELNDHLEAIGAVYRYALHASGVKQVYRTGVQDPGILICPTQLPQATLYVITSESNQTAVAFQDVRSGKRLSGRLQPGRAALLLIGSDGKKLADYNWTSF